MTPRNGIQCGRCGWLTFAFEQFCHVCGWNRWENNHTTVPRTWAEITNNDQ